MRVAPFLPVFCFVALLQACGPPEQPPLPPLFASSRSVHINGTGRFPCDIRPVVVDSSQSRVVLDGSCALVMVTGAHNDVLIGTPPGGRVVLSGHHNDLWWHETQFGSAPTVFNIGSENNIHPYSDNEFR